METGIAVLFADTVWNPMVTVLQVFPFVGGTLAGKQHTYEIYLDLVPSHLETFPGLSS
jgi:hypothetical protein